MDVCQSGFHDQELQRRLVNVPVEGGQRVILCDFCLTRMMEAQQLQKRTGLEVKKIIIRI
jgi:hypothetical protein